MSPTQQAGETLEVLQSILESERDALLMGQAGSAAALLPEKMEAMKAFESLLDRPELIRTLPNYNERMERIIALASENASHFTAVRNGVTSALTRLGSASGNSYVGAYQANGARTAFPKATGGYEKKA